MKGSVNLGLVSSSWNRDDNVDCWVPGWGFIETMYESTEQCWAQRRYSVNLCPPTLLSALGSLIWLTPYDQAAPPLPCKPASYLTVSGGAGLLSPVQGSFCWILWVLDTYSLRLANGWFVAWLSAILTAFGLGNRLVQVKICVSCGLVLWVENCSEHMKLWL